MTTRPTIRTCTLLDVDQHSGTVVVVDVLRAFTTAAVALAGGVERYEVVSTVEEAHARRAADPSVLLLGEVDAVKVPDFDFGNSPWELAQEDVTGRTLVHRSSSGTQGVVRSVGAHRILTASFAVAGATARALATEVAAAASITFCLTGVRENVDGDEDRACAEYITSLLNSDAVVDPMPYLARVGMASAADKFRAGNPDLFPPADLPFVQVVDRYSFAMEVRRVHTERGTAHTLHRLTV
ncbi:2-phosphosulfolactate phosphatase [Euzebya tangerina]|uniref:2-phosphosulfolactate phosphatase n=1 Tax=Euzebya tangerina TaxID=591198 RepID=UPI0013C351FC|nr:2-phosphosulfolactate phosphatase [Euzebya tangerina]